jgi:hypothetical protein
MQAFADAGHALHHRQIRQAGLGQFQEALRIELRIDRRHLGGDVLEAFGVEDFLEGRGGLVGSHCKFLDRRYLSSRPRHRSSRASSLPQFFVVTQAL